MPPRLLPPGSGAGFLGRLAVPAELYWVLRHPAPLAGMSYPRRQTWADLHQAGFRHVVCLTHPEAPYDPSPLAVTAIQLQDLYTRKEPDDPALDRAQTFLAADFVVARLTAGEGVAVHCHAGRGRTGTVIGCALVQLGHDPAVVVDWLHRAQRTRGKRGWPEQAWQADVVLESANR
jgi:Swiss Army Knife protein, DSP-PTPase phosphatase domain